MTLPSAELDHRLCIAPMMDWTDRYCRSFLRLFSAHTLLYTEMVTTGAILHGNRPRFLDFDVAEQPLAIQLGGSEPGDLAATAAIAESWGYREINLNVGCPSDRVQSGRFGACLMGEPELVADCVAAMQAAVKIPVTIKTRIGIDDRDDYEFLHRFVELSTARGCRTFIVHARKAWLQGLSPKENREIPPLRYDVVARLKSEFPQHEIILNGGIRSMQEILQHLETFDGVMIGREAYSNPYLLATADQQLFGDASAPKSREQIVEEYLPYVELRLSEGVPLNRMTRHMLGLFQGQAGARHWRRYLSEHAHEKGAGTEVIRAALHARNAAANPVSS